MKDRDEYIKEAERLLKDSLNHSATLEEKSFLINKAQVFATLALAVRNLDPPRL